MHVASLPCLVCGGSPCQAHHLLRAGGKGMGIRASDDKAVPLCDQHHRELHHYGNEERYLSARGIDGPAEARRIHQLWSER